jgi:hypothetical protein
MFEIDHIPVWTLDRDGALQRLSDATGLPILEGFAPDGRRVARGVRFSNGPFVDVHQADAEGPALLGLSGHLHDAEALAGRQGWRARAERPPDEPDASPWSILSFRRGHGVLSAMFVIDYATEPEAWTSPIFNGGLYHRPAGFGPALRRVWLTAADVGDAGRALEALGFVPAGEARSSVAPHAGQTYRGGRVDIVVARGEDAIVRFDIDGDGPAQIIQIGARLTAVTGRDPAESQQG